MDVAAAVAGAVSWDRRFCRKHRRYFRCFRRGRRGWRPRLVCSAPWSLVWLDACVQLSVLQVPIDRFFDAVRSCRRIRTREFLLLHIDVKQ